ncbi:hypothetical protein A2U01_0054374, partial [Trifolium medium]|nr:hypothetical protein [Trifolium medium]
CKSKEKLSKKSWSENFLLIKWCSGTCTPRRGTSALRRSVNNQ